MIIKPSSLIIIKWNVCISLHFRNLKPHWQFTHIKYTASNVIYFIFISFSDAHNDCQALNFQMWPRSFVCHTVIVPANRINCIVGNIITPFFVFPIFLEFILYLIAFKSLSICLLAILLHYFSFSLFRFFSPDNALKIDTFIWHKWLLIVNFLSHLTLWDATMPILTNSSMYFNSHLFLALNRLPLPLVRSCHCNCFSHLCNSFDFFFHLTLKIFSFVCRDLLFSKKKIRYQCPRAW